MPTTPPAITPGAADATGPPYRLWVLVPGHLAHHDRAVWISVAAGLSAAEAARVAAAATAEVRLEEINGEEAMPCGDT